jgi:hypothetical protein
MGSGEWGVGSGEWGVGSGEWGVEREILYHTYPPYFPHPLISLIPLFHHSLLPTPHSLLPTPHSPTDESQLMYQLQPNCTTF